MSQRAKWSAQLFLVMLCALALKFYYSTASPNQLRWILDPTVALVKIVSGRSFSFESHAGYMSSDHTFLIAASCAGVNFLIILFVLLALRTLFRDRLSSLRWRFIPMTMMLAYVSTIVANTIRICVGLELKKQGLTIRWLNANQLHRLEGIVVYFGFLLLVFMLTDKENSKGFRDLARRLRLPLLVYYVMTLGLPILNGGYREGVEFWEHSTFVLTVPLLLSLMVVSLRFLCTSQRSELSP